MGLFGQKKGTYQVVGLSELKQIVNKHKLVNSFQLGGDRPNIYYDNGDNWSITISSSDVAIYTSRVRFEFDASYNGTVIAIPRRSKIAYYAHGDFSELDDGTPTPPKANVHIHAGSDEKKKKPIKDVSEEEPKPDFSKVRKIVLTADSADVAVIPVLEDDTMDARIFTDAPSSQYTFTTRVKGNTYFIEEKAHGLRCKEFRIELRIPKGSYEALEITTVSGDLEGHMDGLGFDSINVSATSGDIDLESFRAGQVDFQSVSGDVSINGYFYIVNGTSTSGDINVIHSYPGDGSATLSSVSGDISYNPIGITNLCYSANTLSGDVNNNGYAQYDTGYSANVTLSTTSGDINIQ